MLVLPPLDNHRPQAQLLSLADRPDLTPIPPSSTASEQPVEGEKEGWTQEQVNALVSQCRQASQEWWVGKFVKMELPVSVIEGEGEGEGEGEMVNQQEREHMEKTKEKASMDVRLVVAEVVGMSETGFVLQISEDKQIIVNDIISETHKCWLLLKEGLSNLALF